MLSVYPTLLELCGLPAYERNEGISLVPTMKNKEMGKDAFALTTFGMNNHAVKAKGFRYIRYEDGAEELYDHKNDPNEFTNLSKESEYKANIEVMKQYLPTINFKWDAHSSYTFQPYFVEQKARTNGSDGKPVEVMSAAH
jgi:arylsulfatase A-like enzyme